MAGKTRQQQPFRSAKVEKTLEELRRDIILGVYPVGSYIKSVAKISKESGVGVCTSYKIHEILQQEGFVKCIERKGSIVVPFDQEYWVTKIHNEALQNLSDAIEICRQAQIPKEQVAILMQNAYCRQPKPVRESENA